MKIRNRFGPKNPFLGYKFNNERVYKKAKKPRSLLQRYKDEVFGSLADPGIIKRAFLVDQYMKFNGNFMKRKDLPMNDRNFSEYAKAVPPVKLVVNRQQQAQEAAKDYYENLLQDERSLQAFQNSQRQAVQARQRLEQDYTTFMEDDPDDPNNKVNLSDRVSFLDFVNNNFTVRTAPSTANNGGGPFGGGPTVITPTTPGPDDGAEEEKTSEPSSIGRSKQKLVRTVSRLYPSVSIEQLKTLSKSELEKMKKTANAMKKLTY